MNLSKEKMMVSAQINGHYVELHAVLSDIVEQIRCGLNFEMGVAKEMLSSKDFDKAMKDAETYIERVKSEIMERGDEIAAIWKRFGTTGHIFNVPEPGGE